MDEERAKELIAMLTVEEKQTLLNLLYSIEAARVKQSTEQ